MRCYRWKTSHHFVLAEKKPLNHGHNNPDVFMHVRWGYGLRHVKWGYGLQHNMHIILWFANVLMMVHCHAWVSAASFASCACQADSLYTRGAFHLLSIGNHGIRKHFSKNSWTSLSLFVVELFLLQWHESCRQDFVLIYEAAANLAPRTWASCYIRKYMVHAFVSLPSPQPRLHYTHIN